MGKLKCRKIALKVTTMTAHNLERLARMEGISESRVVDKLVRDRMLSLKGREKVEQPEI